MAEKKKAKDEEDLKSTRDVLLKWNEYYMSKDFGIGIQCEKCKKWRQVFQYQDKNEVPESWFCSMWKIDERRRGSCRIPSDVNEEDFEETKYSPGSLVWVKMKGFPWWPAMIEDCPDAQQYYMPGVDGEPEYHVNFFGSKSLRRWIKESYIKDINPPPPMTPKAEKNKELQKSIEQLNEALKMKEKERLAIFSFAVRYKGHWAKVKELDEVDLPPNCLPKKRKEKSSDETVSPLSCSKKKRKRKSSDKVDLPPNCLKEERNEKFTDEVDSPPNCVKKRKEESTDEIDLPPDCLKKKRKEKSADEVDLAPSCLKQRKEKSTDAIDLPTDCLKKKRKEKFTDEVDSPPNCVKKRKEESTDEIDLPTDCLKKKRKEKSADELDLASNCFKKRKEKSLDGVESPLNWSKKKINEKSSDKVELPSNIFKKKSKERSTDEELSPNIFKKTSKERSTDEVELSPNIFKKTSKERSTASKSQGIAREADGNRDSHLTSKVRKRWNVKSKSDDDTASIGESQPTVSHREQIEENKSCKNQVVDLSKAGDNNKQLPSEKSDEQLVDPEMPDFISNQDEEHRFSTEKSDKESDKEDSQVADNIVLSSDEDEDKLSLGKNQVVDLSKAEDNNKQLPSEKSDEQLVDPEMPDFISNQDEEHRFSTEKSDKESDKEDSQVADNIVLSSDEDEDKLSLGKNQVVDLSKAEDNNKQLPSEKSDEQLVDPEMPDFISNQDEEHRFSTEDSDKESDKEDSQASDNIVLSSDEDEDKLSFAEKLYLNFVNHKYPSRIYDSYKDPKGRNNSSNEGSNLVTRNEYASTVSESHSIINHKESDKEDLQASDNIVLSSDEDEDKLSLAEKLYLNFVNRKYPSWIYDNYKDLKSRNNSSNEGSNLVTRNEYASTVSESHSIINHERVTGFSGNDDIVNRENAVGFSEIDDVVDRENAAVFSENNHRNAADCLQNEADVYILDVDPPLLRTQSCHTSKNAAEFSKYNATGKHKNITVFSENNHGNAAEYSQNDSDVDILDTDPSLPQTPYSSCYSPKDATAFSKNNIVIKHENGFPEINHGNAVGCTQNESDVYILDKDSSLLRTPYPSCFNSKTTAKFSKNGASVINKNVTTFSETNHVNSNVYILETDTSLLRTPYPSCYTPKNVASFSENTKNATVFSENNHENAAEYSQNGSNVHILDTDPSLLRTPYSSCYVPKSATEFSRNNSVVIHENAAAFSDNSLGKTAEYSQNDSDVYILNKDTSLMRTPYPPCSTPKTEKFPNHEMSKKKTRTH